MPKKSVKKLTLNISILLLGILNLSMYYDPNSELLSTADYEQIKLDSTRGPALSSYLDGKSLYWESYNTWQCFPTRDLEIDCMEAEYNGIKRVPTIHIIYNLHRFEFSMDPEPEPNCDIIIDRWKNLLLDENTFCTYAAFLQDLDLSDPDSIAKDGSVWIINQLKTSKGYWNFELEDNWIINNR